LLWVLLGIGGGACLWAYRVLSDVDADRKKGTRP
jgi:chromate transporter